MNRPLCQGWHSRRPKPPARYWVQHRDDKAKGMRPLALCGTHARTYRSSIARGWGDVWIVEEITE